jgi:hypothetical protein
MKKVLLFLIINISLFAQSGADRISTIPSGNNNNAVSTSQSNYNYSYEVNGVNWGLTGNLGPTVDTSAAINNALNYVYTKNTQSNLGNTYTTYGGILTLTGGIYM